MGNKYLNIYSCIKIFFPNLFVDVAFGGVAPHAGKKQSVTVQI
jgi:hypothetical protein